MATTNKEKKTDTAEVKKTATAKPKATTKAKQQTKTAEKPATKTAAKSAATKPAVKKADTKAATTKKAATKTTKAKAAKQEAVAEQQVDNSTITTLATVASEEKPTEVSPKPAAPARKTVSKASKAAPKDKWHEIRQSLLEIKATTLSEINKVVKIGSVNQGIEETTGDIYDQASSERERELGLLLNDRERDKLYNIDEALLKMADGDYGICEECEEDIPFGRLKVLPFTRHCVKCKAELEKFQAQTRRIDDDRAYREIPVSSEDDDS